jgi:hypothetical protein
VSSRLHSGGLRLLWPLNAPSFPSNLLYFFPFSLALLIASFPLAIRFAAWNHAFRYSSLVLSSFSYVPLVSAGLIPKRETLHFHPRSLTERSVQQGWSLQSTTCPADSISCGGGACCPLGLYCNPAANDEVAACCSLSNL